MFVDGESLRNRFPFTTTVRLIHSKLIEQVEATRLEHEQGGSQPLQIIPIMTAAGNVAEVNAAISLAMMFYCSQKGMRDQVRKVSIAHGTDEEDEEGDCLEHALYSEHNGFILIEDALGLPDMLKQLKMMGLTERATKYPVLAIFKEGSAWANSPYIRKPIQTDPLHKRSSAELRQLFDHGLLAGWKELCHELPGVLPKKFKAPSISEKLVQTHLATSLIKETHTIQDLLLLARKTTWAIAMGVNEKRNAMKNLDASHLLAADVNQPNKLLEGAITTMRAQVRREQPPSSSIPPPSN